MQCAPVGCCCLACIIEVAGGQMPYPWTSDEALCKYYPLPETTTAQGHVPDGLSVALQEQPCAMLRARMELAHPRRVP